MARRSHFDFSRRGFTIIEAVIAIVILAIAIPPMLWSLREAHVMRVNPVLASQARWLASEKLEDIIADRYSETRGWTYIDSANYPDQAKGTIDSFPAFGRSIDILETGPDLQTPDPAGGFKRITVTVEWIDAGAALRSLELETILTEF